MTFTMLRRFKQKRALDRLLEERLYALALAEFESKDIRQGLWAKSLANCVGDEHTAKGSYLKLRVQSMRDESVLVEAILDELAAQEQGKNTASDLETRKTVEKDVTEQVEVVKQQSAPVVSKLPAPNVRDYCGVGLFARHKGISVETAEHMLKEGFYNGHRFNGIWMAHRDELK